MKNDLLIAIHKDLGYATKSQRGQKTEFLNCIDNLPEFCKHLKARIDEIDRVIKKARGQIDITNKCIPHGINFQGVGIYKSIIEAEYDIEEKLKKMKLKMYNQSKVNFSMGEISMLNAVVDIVNQWLRQNNYTHQIPMIVVKKHYDGPEKPEYIYQAGGQATRIKFTDPDYEKYEKLKEKMLVWDCTFPDADMARYRT
jgi:hypothetical protein